MDRIKHAPRSNWRERVEGEGFLFHSLGGPYWDESTHYRFTQRQAEEIAEVTLELHRLCLEAVAHVVKHERYDEFGIGEADRTLVADSWKAGEATIYGRFDLRYDGRTPPKLYEYNADTPTSLLEASRIQRTWRDDEFPQYDQFNVLHESLVQAWGALDLGDELLHFSSVAASAEDWGTVQYLRSTAEAAGLNTKFLPVEAVGWDDDRDRFVDASGQEMSNWFKLYPWEWLLNERFGAHIRRNRMRLIEPAWKMLLSNKALLPVLWELFPGHPNLLPSYRTSDILKPPYVRKPIFGREGSNVSIQFGNRTEYVPGPYATDPMIYQEFCPLPEFSGRYAMIGSWVVRGRPAGIGIRESDRLISENRSRFVPHIVV